MHYFNNFKHVFVIIIQKRLKNLVQLQVVLTVVNRNII